MSEKQYHVYIMTNPTDTVLYIGVTGNIARRMEEHRSHLLSGFTDKYNCIKLVYVETTNDIESAILREKQLKGWTRKRKIALIESMNPEWKDLANALF